MTARECILDCLIEDDEAYTQIVDFVNFANVEISDEEIKRTLHKMEKSGYIYINYDWTNEHGEYPYSLTEKGRRAWKTFCASS